MKSTDTIGAFDSFAYKAENGYDLQPMPIHVRRERRLHELGQLNGFANKLSLVSPSDFKAAVDDLDRAAPILDLDSEDSWRADSDRIDISAAPDELAVIQTDERTELR
jgi:hypothetical protein